MQELNLYESIFKTLPKDAHHKMTWLALVRCFNSVERVLMRHLAQEYNSSLPRYDVLTALALHQSGLTMGELASMLMVTKGNITGVVGRLKREELVLKNTSRKDRRVQSVKISAKGRRLWEKMHADYDEMTTVLMSGQSDSQIQALVGSLERTRNHVEANAKNLSF